MNRRFTLALILLSAAALVAVACGSDSGTTPDTVTKTAGGVSKASGVGMLIISKPGGLDQYDLKSGAEKLLIAAGQANTFLLDPAVSGDGKQLAYVVQPPAKITGTKYDSGSDLWIANRDGTGAHVVLEHAQPNQLIRYPQWQDSGHLLAIVQEISSAGGRTDVEYWLERVDITSGQRTRVLKDVLSFGLSADARTIVYAKLAPQTGETMNTVSVDGTGDRAIVGIDQKLSPFNSPRFSPDGSSIAFASADQTGVRAWSEYVSARAMALPAAISLDGLPEDIWTVPAAGGAPVRIADLKEDLPALTWGGDGKHIYVVGSAGLYDVNVGTGAQVRIGEGSFHAQIAWAP